MEDDQIAFEHVMRGLAAVDPNLPRTLVKALGGGRLRLAVRFSREVETDELVRAGVVALDDEAGYVPSTDE